MREMEDADVDVDKRDPFGRGEEFGFLQYDRFGRRPHRACQEMIC